MINAEPDLISIVIPVHNGADFVLQTINSCRNQKNLSAELEIIAVNDASTDQTPELLADLEKSGVIRAIHFQNNKGVAAARNAGMKAARGGFIAFLDADDVMKPDKLSKQHHFFQSHPKTDLCFTAVEHIHDSGRYVKTFRIDCPEERQACMEAVFLGRISSFTSTIMFRKTALDVLGGMEESFRHLEDHDFLLRAFNALNVSYLPEPLSVRRLTSLGLSYSISEEQFIETRQAFYSRMTAMFPELIPVTRLYWAEAWFGLGRLFQKTHCRSKAMKWFVKSLGRKFSRSAFMMLIVSLLPWKVQNALEMSRWRALPDELDRLLNTHE